MNEQEIKTAENELSDFHRDYLVRWMEVELERQERASESFLKRRASALEPQTLKASQNQS